MSDVHRAIHDVLAEILDQKGCSPVELRPELKLVDDLQLASLDLAQLVAMLELELGRDPFAQGIPFAGIRTVADLHRAYADEGGP